MKLERFTELADKFDTFYLTFRQKREGNKMGGKTYMVATHQLDTPYIQEKLEKASPYFRNFSDNENQKEVLVFNYTRNNFEVVELSAITRLSQLSHELDKQERFNARSRRF
tara:strand:- start:146 stop:478 length:333 start_codon:yes stop_codon:yes gene_type:complete